MTDVKTLDQMISEAESRKGNATPEEQVKFQGEIDALKAVKAQGVFSQGDLNRIEMQNKQAYEDLKNDIQQTLGGPWEETKQTLENIERQLIDQGSGDGSNPTQGQDPDPAQGQGEGDANPLLTRVVNRMQALEQNTQSFQRELKSERVTNKVNEAFQNAGLQPQYQQLARQVIREDLQALVEKEMGGESVTPEEVQEKVERVKSASSVWFEPEKKPYPNIPPSPEGDRDRELTHEERLNRADVVI